MKNTMEDFFKNHKDKFDVAEPNVGHFERFQARLDKVQDTPKKKGGTPWYVLAIAASFLLFFGYWMGNNSQDNTKLGVELAEVSPQMEETQNFYLATIQKEIEVIKTKKTTANQNIIEDAFRQLELLETNYQKLTLELKESNADKRVIYAMITNFQNRLQILQNLMDQLEEFEELVPQENRV